MICHIHHFTKGKYMSYNTSSIYETMDKYINGVSREVLNHPIWLNINYKDARRPQRVVKVSADMCRAAVKIELHSDDVEYITIGCSRNFVTIHRSGVSSVIFYDCFYMAQEEHEMRIEKQAYDYVCAEFIPVADVYAETHSEYIAHVNLGTFKKAFDHRSIRSRLIEQYEEN